MSEQRGNTSDAGFGGASSNGLDVSPVFGRYVVRTGRGEYVLRRRFTLMPALVPQEQAGLTRHVPHA